MKTVRHLSLIARLVRPHNYISMLVSAITLVLIAPIVDNTPWGRLLMFVLIIFSLLAATIAVSPSKYEKAVGIILAGLALFFMAIARLFHNHLFHSMAFTLSGEALALIFILVTGIIMLRDIFSGNVNANRICGAICVYLLLGFAFAIMQQAVLQLDPQAIQFDRIFHNPLLEIQYPGKSHALSLLIYFSFCTLSTLGYGDITPVSTTSRTLAWLEAVIGQLYLTILVARLVGQYIADLSNKHHKL